MGKFIEENDKLLYEYLVNNDHESLKKLINVNLNLISYVLNKLYSRSGRPENGREEFHDEYYSYGYEGLVRAIQMFDKERIGNVKFSTYACIWIESKISRQIFREIDRNKRSVSFETPINEKGDTLGEFIPDEDADFDGFEEREYDRYKRNKVIEAMEILNKKDRKILDLYFGFSDGRKKSQDEVAEILGISKSYISFSLRRSCAKLGEMLKEFEKEYGDGNMKEFRLKR